jgi:hypothetical protein
VDGLSELERVRRISPAARLSPRCPTGRTRIVTNRRRSYMTGPGDSLILPPSSFNLATMFESFVADTGIDPDRLVFDPVVGSPLPMRDYGRGPQGWDPELNPAMFWHPLFWLPDAIAVPLDFHDQNGDEQEEDLNLWALRVAWEVVWSGMYDAEDGTWADILSLYGLDVEAPDVQARITAWLSGAADPVLDTVNLAEYISENQDSNVLLVVDQAEPFRTASWGVHADELVTGLGHLLRDAKTEEEYRWAVGQIAYVATLALGDTPPLNDGGQPFAAAWATIIEEADNPSTAIQTIQARAQYLQQSLTSLARVFYPEYQQLMTLLAQEDQVPDRGQLTAPTPAP